MGMKFTDEELAGGGDFIGVGVHEVMVKRVTKGKSAAGNDKIEVVVADSKKRERTLHLSLSPKAMWKIAGLAKSCGLSDDYLKSGDFLPSKDLPGKKFQLVIEEKGTRMVNGEEKKQYVEYFNALEGVENNEPSYAEDNIPF